MLTVKDLAAFESKMRQERGWKRGRFCEELGISQGKLRRMLDGRKPEDKLEDRTLALAISAVALNLAPYPETAANL